jgi:hypothetical protein
LVSPVKSGDCIALKLVNDSDAAMTTGTMMNVTKSNMYGARKT